MAGNFGSNPFRHSNPTQSPLQTRGNVIRLRLELFSYERETIEAQISSYIQRLLRRNPSFIPEDYKLLHIHDVIQFHIIGEHSKSEMDDSVKFKEQTEDGDGILENEDESD